MSSPRSRRWLWPIALLAAAAVAAAALFVSSRFSTGATAPQRPAAVAQHERSAPPSPAPQTWVPAEAPPVAQPPEKVSTDAPAVPVAERGDGVTVHVSSAAWNPERSAVEVSGFVPAVAESDGTCTATLTNGSTSVTATADAIANGDFTACGELAVAGLSPGAWDMVLSYESGAHEGASPAVAVDVP